MFETTFFVTPKMFFKKPHTIFFQKLPKLLTYVYFLVKSDIYSSIIFKKIWE